MKMSFYSQPQYHDQFGGNRITIYRDSYGNIQGFTDMTGNYYSLEIPVVNPNYASTVPINHELFKMIEKYKESYDYFNHAYPSKKMILNKQWDNFERNQIINEANVLKGQLNNF
jgi:hypothetical protein